MDITSFVLGMKMGKNSGGGTHPDLRYVTFMNGDEVLYVKPVAVGDDCVDVYTKGFISKPTKESDVQYKYTYSGWSIANDNTVDSNALKAVTEDRTVYACYTSAVRKYTITYYDGGTVLKTEQLEYGSMPSYVAEKDGFNFEGWEPKFTTVTGDASYYAQWSSALTFDGASWADISRLAESGEASQYFAVGDEKKISIDGTSYTVRILGYNHDDLADGSGKAKMTMQLTTSLSDTFNVSDWNTLSSDMETTLLPKFPSELRSLIKSVTKPCDVFAYEVYGKVVTPVNVNFKLFPLSMTEMCIRTIGKRRYTDADWETNITTLGTPYQYYENKYYTPNFGPSATLGSAGAWIRQYSRADGADMMFGLTTTMYLSSYFSGDSKSYTSSAKSQTVAKIVQVAFCI